MITKDKCPICNEYASWLGRIRPNNIGYSESGRGRYKTKIYFHKACFKKYGALGVKKNGL